MQFAAALARSEDSIEVVDDLVLSLNRQLHDRIDLLVLFMTHHYQEQAQEIAESLQKKLTPGSMIGCTCEGVIENGREIEDEPAISALAARMPGVTIQPFGIHVEEWHDFLESSDDHGLSRRIGADRNDLRAFIMLADPFTTPINEMMASVDRIAPGIPLVGGMASGANSPGNNAMLLSGSVRPEGLVGVTLSGNIQVETIVSQGCRPVGERYLVTAAAENLILRLGGKPALEVVRELVGDLAPEDEQLLQNGLFIGVTINEYQSDFTRGDFLVRAVLGADPNRGGVAIGDIVRSGQTVQFHVRDAGTADEDLRALLARTNSKEMMPGGALLFSCNGRGTHMFEMPNHDARALQEAVPETPAAGFFAMGELGPIGGKSFIHSQTASIALFYPTE